MKKHGYKYDKDIKEDDVSMDDEEEIELIDTNQEQQQQLRIDNDEECNL